MNGHSLSAGWSSPKAVIGERDCWSLALASDRASVAAQLHVSSLRKPGRFSPPSCCSC